MYSRALIPSPCLNLRQISCQHQHNQPYIQASPTIETILESCSGCRPKNKKKNNKKDTNFVNEGSLLGEGSLGPVYKAKFPNGIFFYVKIINMAGLSYREEEMFLDVICTTSKLKHPKIIPLNGYCLEHREHLLVYDYFGNLTLYDALHSGTCETLSWAQHLRISL
ncbi:hypothetical protein RYX36_013646 [Vicia faba]